MFLTDPDLLVGRDSTRKIQIHPSAVLETSSLGPGTAVGAFVRVAGGVVTGEDCRLGDHVMIEAGVVLGDRVTIEAGSYVGRGLVIEDDVFIGSQTVLGRDEYPRRVGGRGESVRSVIRRGASVGSGVVVESAVEIGAFAMVRSGSVVTRSAPAFSLISGQPGQVVGRVDRSGRPIGGCLVDADR
jgi:UDP-3-O-[3-hydroxymyristoyl] glucosamine N-acyltransferase